jgi:hypothetical protein
MSITFTKLTIPDPKVAALLNQWENDPSLVPLIRPVRNEEDLEKQESITVASLTERLEHTSIYLIYDDGKLVGEISLQIDPQHILKKEPAQPGLVFISGKLLLVGRVLAKKLCAIWKNRFKPKGCHASNWVYLNSTVMPLNYMKVWAIVR